MTSLVLPRAYGSLPVPQLRWWQDEVEEMEMVVVMVLSLVETEKGNQHNKVGWTV